MPEKKPLDNEYIPFFYELFSQYESEENHKGYNFNRIDKDFKKKISLKYKAKQENGISRPSTRNTIVYTGNRKVADLLRHVRNAFAHCHITISDQEFFFYDEHKGKCSMNGRMNKTDFFRLIKELNKTRT